MAAPTTCPVAPRARIRRCRVDPPAPWTWRKWSTRVIGIDVHRAFAQVAILDGGKVVREQRIDLVQDKVLAFGQTLRLDDEVVLEATGNTAAIERLLRPFVGRVVITNPRMVRAIAYARVKTDTISRFRSSGHEW